MLKIYSEISSANSVLANDVSRETGTVNFNQLLSFDDAP